MGLEEDSALHSSSVSVCAVVVVVFSLLNSRCEGSMTAKILAACLLGWFTG